MALSRYLHDQLKAMTRARRQIAYEKELARLRKEEGLPEAPLPPLAEAPPKNSKFPRRAVWLSNRLKERGWRKNHLRQFGGPDRKTVQKILDGLPVREEALEKVIVALNKKKVGVPIDLLSIPSD